jgi:hypothetical protein
MKIKFGTGKSNGGVSILPALCVSRATTEEGKHVGITVVFGWLSWYAFLVIANIQTKLDVIHRDNVLKNVSVHTIH